MSVFSSSHTLYRVGLPGTQDTFIVKYDTNGIYKWATQMGRTSYDGGNDISTDSFGNVYVTGLFNDTSLNIYDVSAHKYIDGVESDLSLSNVDGTGQDVFIVKYDTNGNYCWATQMGGTSNDYGNSISTDSLGNVYVTGYFNDASLKIYDASAHKYIDGVTSDLSLSNIGLLGTGNDVFIVKYDTSGNYCWATQMGGNSSDAGTSISTDSLGNVYVTGYFYDTSLNIYDASAHKYIDGGASDLSLSKVTGGIQDTFIVKYDTNGVYKWATQMGGTSWDIGTSISTDSLGNVYVTGYFNDTSLNIYDASAHKYNGGDSDLSLSNIGGTGQDVFIVKYDTNGNYKWATQMGGTSYDVGNDISTDSFGNVYITGIFSDASLNIYDASAHKYAGGDSDLSLSIVGGIGSDVFIVKYDTSGNYCWATQMGGIANDNGTDISTDSLGNVYVTGSFEDTCLNIYDASAHKYAGVATSDLSLSNIGGTGFDTYIVKYDTSGNYCWATQMGGTATDAGTGISTDRLGNVYVTGGFSNAILNICDALQTFVTPVNNVPVIISNICFPAGTPVHVDQGVIAIDKINPLIHTIRGKQIMGVSKTVSTDKYLVCIEKGALMNNSPNKQTIISRNHKILYKNECICAKDLVGKFGNNVRLIEYNGEPLYNIIMEDYVLVIINNLMAETLHPSNSVVKQFIQ
jgi:hypothetical protein